MLPAVRKNVDQTWVEKVEYSRFFPSSYGSHLTIIWKLLHVASV
jgi:hypothetical protein